MLRKILALTLALLSCMSTANANTVFETVYEPLNKAILLHNYTLTDVLNDKETPSIETFETEVDYLESQIPVVKSVYWNVYVVNKRLSWGQFNFAGYATHCANGDNYITMFSYPQRSYRADKFNFTHEAGHLLRFQYITDDELAEYMELRNDGKKHTGYFDTPDELFAEDFATLFCSVRHIVGSRSTYPAPTTKEKTWILEKLEK